MAKYWKDELPKYRWINELTPTYIYYIEVCKFTFHFTEIEHIKETRDWFSEKIHKSTRLPDGPWLQSEHDVAQRWYERLPASIKKSSKRERVIKALDDAITKFS